MTDSENGHVGESSRTCQQRLEKRRQNQRLVVEKTQPVETSSSARSHPNENQQNKLSREIGPYTEQNVVRFQSKSTPVEHESISNVIPSVPGTMGSNMAPPKSNTSYESLLSQNISGSSTAYHPPFLQSSNNNNNNNNARAHSISDNISSVMSPSPQENYEFHHNNREKSIILGILIAALNEMAELLKFDIPISIESSISNEFLFNWENYEEIFSNPNQPGESPTTRFESSKVYGVVPMNVIELIQNFLDPIKWMNMFPTIVTKARTVEVLDSGDLGGSMQLMYEKLHILSPLVEARNYYFIRYFRKLDEKTWIMVDVSYDLIKEIQSGETSHAWKFPSGCAIQDLEHGESRVTWIEHVQVDEKIPVHNMFLPLLIDRQTYGAKRWIVTLQRMCERYSVEVGATSLSRHDPKQVLNDPEILENIMQISLRMVKRFCEILSMTEKLDFPTSSKFKSEDRVSIRKNEDITQQKGFIITAATSLWLPLSCRNVFNFLKDNNSRCQWDVLAGENTVTELARIETGCVPGNNITIIQPYVPEEKNMLILQESAIDELGAFLIYAPIDLSTVNSIFNGGDVNKVSILPSGFIICPDGRHNLDTYITKNAQNGSILTMAFQILICHADNASISLKQQKSAVTSVHNLLSSTVLKIKATLGCSD
ncbi:homeobox-leucine zipper protein HDG11-like [Solanum lycopersicum]|uniref:homeobox-leucine zipper protein HDG11-like n=1 Tax=Solanum lycopersicum TaxID=4081 RepID=UPI00374788E6